MWCISCHLSESKSDTVNKPNSHCIPYRHPGDLAAPKQSFSFAKARSRGLLNQFEY
jgi:hypothetical protein